MTDEEKITLLEKRLDVIDTALMGKVTTDVKSYEINGRSIDKYSPSELTSIYTHFKTQLEALKNKIRPRKILTRFV